jgi:hypothetical protein
MNPKRSIKKILMAAIGMEFFDPWKKANNIFGVESTLPPRLFSIEGSITIYYIYSI